MSMQPLYLKKLPPPLRPRSAEAVISLKVTAEAKQKDAEANMLRVQATFDEQKNVMEEMFVQIEKLDALRTELEQQLAEANLAGKAVRTEVEEAKAALAVMTGAKNDVEADAAAAAQRHNHELARRDEEFITAPEPEHTEMKFPRSRNLMLQCLLPQPKLTSVKWRIWSLLTTKQSLK